MSILVFSRWILCKSLACCKFRLFVAIILSAVPIPALAVDATWLNAPASVDWNSGINWSGGSAPVNPGDTATFATSTQSSPTLSGNVTITSITFNPGASAFSIQLAGVDLTLQLQGVGIINDSRNVQTINNSGLRSSANFFGASTAANATINHSGPSSSASFAGTSSAANATINNSGSNSSANFFATSTAANATINNSGPSSSANFLGASTAANATIVNSGARSFTVFTLGASGGTAALINANPRAFITIAELNGTGTTLGSIAGNGAIFLGSKNLTVGGNQQSAIFSGVISDGESPDLPPVFTTGQPSYIGGSLTKIGSGTLTLTGTNTYTGGTIINAGTLQLGNGGTAGSITGNILNNGIFAFNRSNSMTFGGVISGPGSVQQNGIGRTVLVGNNTYTGGTSINAGTLQLGNGGTAGSITGNVLNNGILVFNRSDFVTFDGSIRGTGSLAKLGRGTLALSDSNIYRGGTAITRGTIVTRNVLALGTGPVAFDNGTMLRVQNLLNVNGSWRVFPGRATVDGGTVQTFGDFNLGGGGTLITNANFNVRGAANINSSGFVVNRAFTVNENVNLNGSNEAVVNGLLTAPGVNVNNISSLVINNPGVVAANMNVRPSALLGLFGAINGNVVNAGFFQGTGVVNGNVTNRRIVSPGTSIGSLRINGNYTQSASGTLRIEVAGASPGQYRCACGKRACEPCGNAPTYSRGRFWPPRGRSDRVPYREWRREGNVRERGE